ncbi:Proteasome subunit alpha type-4-A [Durusdinium trenchii]|uniref:Proteasome subunit alpha type-4-A n=1 Tax=Durusdinium trenchii TaxID=1381693 RepID=A0ABP0MHG2_9DINO
MAGNHFEAMSFVKKSKKLYTKESDREGQVSAWLLLARCHLAAKNHEEAQSSCREAHALCEETKNYQQEIEVWQQVVELHMATSHHEAALQAAAKRLEVAQRNKASVKDQVEALDVICTLYLVMKNVPEAERSAAEMLRMAKLNESLIDLEIAALIQLVQVNILRLSESAGGAASAGKALQYAEQAWALASRDSAGLDYKSSAKYWHAEALIGAGRHPQALTAAREAEQFFKQMVVKDSGGLFRSILLQGRLERSLGKLEESKQSVERALSLATEAKNQAWQKMAREELACFAARWVHCAERTAVWGVKISKGQSMLELKQKLGTCLQLILYNYRGIPEK